MAKSVYAFLAGKWLELLIVTYKAYVIQLGVFVIAMNALMTRLRISIQECLLETRSKY